MPYLRTSSFTPGPPGGPGDGCIRKQLLIELAAPFVDDRETGGTECLTGQNWPAPDQYAAADDLRRVQRLGVFWSRDNVDRSHRDEQRSIEPPCGQQSMRVQEPTRRPDDRHFVSRRRLTLPVRMPCSSDGLGGRSSIIQLKGVAALRRSECGPTRFYVGACGRLTPLAGTYIRNVDRPLPPQEWSWHNRGIPSVPVPACARTPGRGRPLPKKQVQGR